MFGFSISDELAAQLLCDALKKGKPIDDIRAIVAKHPRAVSTRLSKWHRQVLPLHVACSHGASLEILLFLVGKFPDSVRMSDDDGLFAIDHALQLRHGNGVSTPALDYLVDVYGETVVGDANASLLHWACRTTSHKELLFYLIEKYPETVDKKDGDGYLPLHTLAAVPRFDHERDHCEKLSALIEAEPFTVLSKTNEGETPSQLASSFRIDAFSAFLQQKESEMERALEELRQMYGIIAGDWNLPSDVVLLMWSFAVPDYISLMV